MSPQIKGAMAEKKLPGEKNSQQSTALHKILKTRHQVEIYMEVSGKLRSTHFQKKCLSKNIYLLLMYFSQFENSQNIPTSRCLSMILKFIRCTYVIIS